MRKFWKLAIAASALALAAGSASAANAAYVFNAEGQSQTILFNGFNNDVLDGDLKAQLKLTLFDINASGDLVFDYEFRNLSTGDDSDSNLVNFGFNTDPNFQSASIVDGFFSDVRSGNVVAGQPNVELCATNAANCTGGGNAAATLQVGELGAGRFLLDFAQPQTTVSLDNLQVRWTSLGANNEGSGYGLPTGVVPEPATWAMMIGGFAAIGSALRRRRAVTALDAHRHRLVF